jgi:hypothetical protein
MENEQVDMDEFSAGFNGSQSQVTETPTSDNDEVNTVDAPKLATITEEQFQEMTRRLAEIDEIKASTGQRMDKAFGKLGSIEQVLGKLQSSTPSGEQVNISTEDFAELAEEYPEIAKMQIAGLNKVLSKMKGTSGSALDEESLNRMVAERLEPALNNVRQQIEQNSEVKFLNYMQSDWREIVGLPDEQGVIPKTEFRQWLSTQPSDYQEKVNNAWDASVIHSAVKTFQGTKKEVNNQEVSDRKKQISAAITPKSSGNKALVQTAQDEFAAGFYGK